MSDPVHTMVFAYDISSNRSRRKVAAILEDCATRVQHSVFEAKMTRTQSQKTLDMISPYIDDGDSVRVYALTKAGRQASLSLGGVPLPEDEEFWLI